MNDTHLIFWNANCADIQFITYTQFNFFMMLSAWLTSSAGGALPLSQLFSQWHLFFGKFPNFFLWLPLDCKYHFTELDCSRDQSSVHVSMCNLGWPVAGVMHWLPTGPGLPMIPANRKVTSLETTGHNVVIMGCHVTVSSGLSWPWWPQLGCHLTWPGWPASCSCSCAAPSWPGLSSLRSTSASLWAGQAMTLWWGPSIRMPWVTR